MLLGRDETDQLLGIAPFFLTHNQNGERVLMLLGSFEIADYFDFIARLKTQELPTHWYIVDDESSLDAEIDAFIALMAQDVEKERFLTSVMRSQLQSSIHAAFRAGWLQLAFIEINGQKAAGYLNFDFGNHIWLYNSGLNYAFGELSPSWVLLGYLLQWANEHGRRAFGFMRGDEDYKYRFGAIDRFVLRATMRRS